MDIKLINVGYGNFISSSRIIAIIGPESAPVKRMIQEAREERRVRIESLGHFGHARCR